MMKTYEVAFIIAMSDLKMFLSSAEEIKAFRKKLGVNQGVFWSRVGVTQSGGSRYEAGGRRIPKTLQLLLHVTYAPEVRAQRVVQRLRDWATSKADPA
jgi:DNA-binding transcriptional regulator YiaG